MITKSPIPLAVVATVLAAQRRPVTLHELTDRCCAQLGRANRGPADYAQVREHVKALAGQGRAQTVGLADRDPNGGRRAALWVMTDAAEVAA